VGTFTVNLAGALILGWLVIARERWRPLVGTGFCGALTTFSTFQVQLVQLGDDGHVALAGALGAYLRWQASRRFAPRSTPLVKSDRRVRRRPGGSAPPPARPSC
jgi:fluoride ion exporter CrcB/FEX